MLLESLTLTAFRGMAEVALERLSDFSLVVGANNAGKSSILEATSLLLRPFDPPQWIQVARQRDFDVHPADGLWSLFPSGTPLELDDGPKQSRLMSIQGSIHGNSRTLKATGLASAGWESGDDTAITLDIKAQVFIATQSRPFSHTMEFRRDVPAKYSNEVPFFRCFTITPATHRSTRQLVDHLSRAVDEGHKGFAVELLKRFDPDVIDLDVSATLGREGVRVNHKTRGVVDLASFGDGMRRCAALALALVRARDGVLLVDELEAGIHPTILSNVLSSLFHAANEANVQILATTHSLEAIDGVMNLVRDEPQTFTGFYLRRKDGKHLVRRYSYEELISLREEGLDIR